MTNPKTLIYNPQIIDADDADEFQFVCLTFACISVVFQHTDAQHFCCFVVGDCVTTVNFVNNIVHKWPTNQ